MKSVYFYTLGCSKNDVDTYHMQSFLINANMVVAEDLQTADAIVINTCGFIHDAKMQSIEAIWEIADAIEGQSTKLVIAGCLGQRYPIELMEEIPRIDGILGTSHVGDVVSFLKELEQGERLIKTTLDETATVYPKVYSEHQGATGYLKISEGCDNRCAYCIIPSLRGNQRSRPIEELVKEAKKLAEDGVRELIIIAQNTGDYGTDLYGKKMLPALIREIAKIQDIKWIRLLYMYPDYFTEELIDLFATEPKLLHYVDVPLQHIDDDMLAAMNRKTTREEIVSLVMQLREKVPDMIFRSTFIVGFPGETNASVDKLKAFLSEIQLDKVGIFTYSDEEGTASYQMKPKVAQETMKVWRDELMEVLHQISAEKMQSHVGKTLSVLVEEVENEVYVGRSYMDAPDVDGVVYVRSNRLLEPGEFVNVLIDSADDYDLQGGVVNESSQ